MSAKPKLNAETLQAQIDAYFEKCQNTMVKAVYGKALIDMPKPPSMAGLALHLGIESRTLYRYLDGSVKAGENESTGNSDCDGNGVKDAPESIRLILARARDRIVAELSEGAAMGRYNDRIVSAQLARLGEVPAERIEHTGTIAVQWTGVDPSDAERWGG